MKLKSLCTVAWCGLFAFEISPWMKISVYIIDIICYGVGVLVVFGLAGSVVGWVLPALCKASHTLVKVLLRAAPNPKRKAPRSRPVEEESIQNLTDHEEARTNHQKP